MDKIQSIKFSLKKNQIVTLLINDLSSEGHGVGHYVDDEGEKKSETRPLAVFIPGALPGETVEVKIVKVAKRCAWGRLVRVVRAGDARQSPERREPTCPHYRLCGGCNMAHMSYSAELKFKRKKVVDALQRIGDIDNAPNCVDPVVPSPSIKRYRNKSAYPVGPAGIGMYRTRSHDIVPVKHCEIQSAEAEAAVGIVAKWMHEFDVPAYNERQRTGLVRHVFVRSNWSGEFLLCLVCNSAAADEVQHVDELVCYVRKALPKCIGVILNFNTRNTNVILGRDYECVWGADTLTDEICGLQFCFSIPSFFQVNRKQAAALYKRAIELARLEGDNTVADLYCGVGTITLLMAMHCKMAYGVEIVPEAVNNAWHNACKNGIKNVEFSCMDAGEFAAGLLQRGVHPDIVCVDPPRAGLNAECVSALHKLAPSHIVYISCKPSTLARDLALLRDSYRIAKVEPFDMFPRTHHVETLVLLKRIC